jgi:hypothetical protein
MQGRFERNLYRLKTIVYKPRNYTNRPVKRNIGRKQSNRLASKKFRQELQILLFTFGFINENHYKYSVVLGVKLLRFLMVHTSVKFRIFVGIKAI